MPLYYFITFSHGSISPINKSGWGHIPPKATSRTLLSNIEIALDDIHL